MVISEFGMGWYGTSPFLKGKSSINGSFSIAMLNYQGVKTVFLSTMIRFKRGNVPVPCLPDGATNVGLGCFRLCMMFVDFPSRNVEYRYWIPLDYFPDS